MSEGISGVLLIAQPGRTSAGLRVLLKSLYPLIQIDQSEDVPILLPLIDPDRRFLVLIDMDLPDEEAWQIAADIRSNWSLNPLMLLAHDAHQEERIRRSGFDCLPLNGITASGLSAAFGCLTQGSDSGGEEQNNLQEK